METLAIGETSGALAVTTAARIRAATVEELEVGGVVIGGEPGTELAITAHGWANLRDAVASGEFNGPTVLRDAVLSKLTP